MKIHQMFDFCLNLMTFNEHWERNDFHNSENPITLSMVDLSQNSITLTYD
jgi:hypothetical protein